MRIGVTGGGGFLGTHVLEVLDERGIEWMSYDVASGSDVLDVEAVKQLGQCDSVIHLAGVLGTSELFDDPRRAIEVNVVGTLNVLQMCAEQHTGFVGITVPDVWDNVYQATKVSAQRLAGAWYRHQGVGVSMVRAFNAYGPGQHVYGVQKIMPTFATRAWRNEPIPIWGDGRQKVDMVYAGDIAEMLVDATKFTHNEVFDAGTGIGTSVAEVAEMVLHRTGSTAGIKYLPMRKGEHEADVVAIGEGWEQMGWKPQPRLDKIAMTIDYYREERP